MINLLPSPRKCEIVSEDTHLLLATVYTDYDFWRDTLDAFCERFEKQLGIKPHFEPFADINLIFDPSLPDAAFMLDSTAAIVLRASTREGAVRGFEALLQILQYTDGLLLIPSLIIED